MNRQKAQSELYALEVQQFKLLLADPDLTASDRIKVLKELREFLKDNGTTASAVDEKLKGIVQTKLENNELDDEWEDPDEGEFKADLRVVGE